MIDPALSGTGPRGRRRHRVTATTRSSAPPLVVWALLADVTTWTGWAGFREASYAVDGAAPAPHGVGAVRQLRAGPLSSRETVLEYVPARRLVYDYVGSLPFTDYRAEVTLRPTADGSVIDWRADFSAANPVVAWVLHLLVARVLEDMAARLAHAADAAAP